MYQAFARILAVLALAAVPAIPAAAEDPAPYLRDRGPGIATSMFGTYVRKHELLVYPFYEFYYNHNEEYDPAEFSYPSGQREPEFEGKFVGHEGLMYLAFAITDYLMIEMEAAVMSAKLEKADDDPSAMPPVLEEAGLGDVEGQLRWRYVKEREKLPEIFSFLEVVFPTRPEGLLIGSRAWEFKFGTGLTKGFPFGTLTGRFAVEYDGEDEEIAPGEWGVEYLKRVSEHLALFGMVEGSGDEIELIAETQIHFTERIFWKINCGFGLTPKAQDLAPETGLVFAFRFGGD